MVICTCAELWCVQQGVFESCLEKYRKRQSWKGFKDFEENFLNQYESNNYLDMDQNVIGVRTSSFIEKE